MDYSTVGEVSNVHSVERISLKYSKELSTVLTGLKLRVRIEKLIFLFLNQNICCGYSKEPSHRDGSFEHPQHMLKLIANKIFTILRSKSSFF